MICPNCKKENSGGAKFCAGCGSTLADGVPSAAQAAPGGSLGKSRRISAPMVALAVLVLGGAWMIFFQNDSLVGTYTLTNAEEVYFDAAPLFNKPSVVKNEKHTITIKKGNRFEKYDSYGNGEIKELFSENSGTYATKGDKIVFSWTDSKMNLESGLECTLVEGGFDCKNSIFKPYQYRKQK